VSAGDLFQTAAGGFFNVPIARNWFYIIGIMPASKKNIVDKLRNKDHVSILDWFPPEALALLRKIHWHRKLSPTGFCKCR